MYLNSHTEIGMKPTIDAKNSRKEKKKAGEYPLLGVVA
jgi:hypothetical protein